MQTGMRDLAQPEYILWIESELKNEHEKWTKKEKNILKWNSWVQWLQLRGSNNAYVHANLKSRSAHNKICSLTTATGLNITSTEEITVEVLEFYQKLLGSTTDYLPCVNKKVMKDGIMLNKNQQQE